MKKSVISTSIVVILLVLAILIYLFKAGFAEFGANKEQVNLNEYFQASGDELALFYNDELQSAKGVEKDGVVYLPLNWVSSILNDKFYWSSEDELLIYTLPESVLNSDYSTLGQNAKPLLIKQGEEPYISIAVVNTYTDMQYRIFDDNGVKRIFLSNTYGEYVSASVKGKVSLRAGASLGDKVVKVLNGGENLRLILEDTSQEYLDSKALKWIKVLTEDGYIGYIRKKNLHRFSWASSKSSFKPLVYSGISLGEKVILAWHQVSNAKANENMEALLENTSGINVLSPTWFSLSDNAGNYNSLASKDYVDKAHAKGIQVWALIDNFSTEVNSLTLLSSTEARRNLITSLIKDAKALGLDGLNLDFEGLKQESGKHYIQFIRELSVETRKNGIILSVDNPSYASFNTFYGRAKQAEVADYIINMGYDEHYAGSEKGSVASIGFVKGGIDKSLTEVPKEKLINAVPAYTRIWTDSGSKALGIKAALEWIESNQVQLVWKDTEGQYYGEALVDGEMSYIWMEEEKSLGLKVSYAKEKDIGGIAVWKLGLEPPEVWEVISRIRP